jgi:anthranilate phosphoribosyltransferase
MTSPLNRALRLVAEGRTLTAEQAADAFRVIMVGDATPALIGALLLGLRARGETADEVAGAATALREAMVPVRTAAGSPLVDTCGTGGGGIGTFNISTAAALVVAAAGARVPKHGNRSYTSKCGSADVLEALGVDIGAGPEDASLRLDAAGMVFLFAPNYHPAMRHVGPTRKELGVATIMNLLGPLANPAGVRRQVIGVADASRGPLMADALVRLGAEHAMVVHGEVGMDEISPAGSTMVWEVRGGQVVRWAINPDSLGLGWERLEDLAGGEPTENARRIEALVSGARDEAARRAVLLNAGAALYVAGLAADYPAAVALAAEVLMSGEPGSVLTRLRQDASP